VSGMIQILRRRKM